MIDGLRFRAGDPEHFEELVRRYGPLVMSVVDSFGDDPDHREDLDAEDSLVARLLELKDLKPWVTVVDGGPLYDPLVRRLEDGGLVAFRKVDRAVRLLGIWARWKMVFGRG